MQHRSGALWTVNARGAAPLGLARAAEPGVERDPRGPHGPALAGRRLAARPPAGPARPTSPRRRRARPVGHHRRHRRRPPTSPPRSSRDRRRRRPAARSPRPCTCSAPRSRRTRRPGLAAGPYKIVLADSGLPGLDELAATIRRGPRDRPGGRRALRHPRGPGPAAGRARRRRTPRRRPRRARRARPAGAGRRPRPPRAADRHPARLPRRPRRRLPPRDCHGRAPGPLPLRITAGRRRAARPVQRRPLRTARSRGRSCGPRSGDVPPAARSCHRWNG